MTPTEATAAPPDQVALTKSVEVPMEVLKYKEDLLRNMGLPSSYAMGVLKELCNDLVDSGFAPSHFKGNPMALFLAAMRGREMDLAPMESILETFWAAPGGRLGIYSNKAMYIMHGKGVTTEIKVETKDRCEILFTPPAPHLPYLASFDFEEARAAGLVKPDSNWIKWPIDMNRARAIARGWRVIGGTFKGSANLYLKEELEDMPVEYEPAQTNIPSDQPVVEVVAGSRPKSRAPEPEPAPPPPPPNSADSPVAAVFEFAGFPEEKSQARLDTAMLMGQALAANKGVPVTILRRAIDGHGVETATSVAVCEPPTPVEDTAKDTFNTRAREVYATIPGPDDKTRKTLGDMFLNGFYGVSVPREWPRTIDARYRGLTALAAALTADVGRFESAVSARAFGQEAAAPKAAPVESRPVKADPSEGLYESFGWSPATRSTAAAFKARWESSAQDFADYAGALKLGSLSDEDARAFLAVGARMGRSFTQEGAVKPSYPMQLMTDLVRKGAKGYAVIVSALEMNNGDTPLDKIPEAKIMSDLQVMLARQAEPAKTVAATGSQDDW